MKTKQHRHKQHRHQHQQQQQQQYQHNQHQHQQYQHHQHNQQQHRLDADDHEDSNDDDEISKQQVCLNNAEKKYQRARTKQQNTKVAASKKKEKAAFKKRDKVKTAAFEREKAKCKSIDIKKQKTLQDTCLKGVRDKQEEWKRMMKSATKAGQTTKTRKDRTGSDSELGRALLREHAVPHILWPPAGQFISVSVSGTMACGIRVDRTLACWGLKAPEPFVFPHGVTYTSVSVQDWYLCAVREADNTPVCWASLDGNWRIPNGEVQLPKKSKWAEEPSCQTSHPELSGAASCTSCDPHACNRHFTITDPKTNTGTCTKTECPFCKPKSCCGAHHKHYVLNTESLEGICVRHNDDCTPVCVPQGVNNPSVKRVCSKGCNQLAKVMRNPEASTEAEMYDLAVCQNDKRIVCSPKVDGTGGCSTQSAVKTTVVCRFSMDLWNLGPTCIANHMHKSDFPDCPEGREAAILSINNPGTCRLANTTDDGLCERLGMSF